MFNEKFWLAIAFLAFLALLLKFARTAIAKSLDDKSKAIAEEILAAKELKEKAIRLLASTEKYAQESANYAAQLIKDAELEAQKFLNEAQKSADEEVAKKTAAALERIKQEEAVTIRDIKNKIIHSALKEAENGALKNLNEKQNETVLSKATQDFGQAI